MIRILSLFFVLLSFAAQAETRLLVTSAAATDILLKLGAADRIAAIDDFGKIIPGAANLPSIGRAGALPLEKIAEKRLTHAIVWHYQTELARNCRSLGIAVEEIAPVTLKNYPDLVLLLGKLAGCEAEAEKLRAVFTVEQANLPPPPPRRIRVYLELYAPYKTAGQNSYSHELLTCAGAENIGGILPVSGAISPESILAAAPEVIFYIEGSTDPEELKKRPAFVNLPAVVNKKVYPLPRLWLVAGVSPMQTVSRLRDYLK